MGGVLLALPNFQWLTTLDVLRVTFQQTRAEQMLIPLQAKTEIHSIHFLVLTEYIVLNASIVNRI